MAQAAPNIIVVEDDRETRTRIAKYMRKNKRLQRDDGKRGREMVRAHDRPRRRLLILDVIAGRGEDGLSLAARCEPPSQTPSHSCSRERPRGPSTAFSPSRWARPIIGQAVQPARIAGRINAVLRRQDGGPRNLTSATEGANRAAFGWGSIAGCGERRNPPARGWDWWPMTSAGFDLLRTFCERPAARACRATA